MVVVDGFQCFAICMPLPRGSSKSYVPSCALRKDGRYLPAAVLKEIQTTITEALTSTLTRN